MPAKDSAGLGSDGIAASAIVTSACTRKNVIAQERTSVRIKTFGFKYRKGGRDVEGECA